MKKIMTLSLLFTIASLSVGCGSIDHDEKSVDSLFSGEHSIEIVPESVYYVGY